METYDLDSVYVQEIYPLVEHIIQICEKYRLPGIMGFQVGPEVFYTSKLLFNERTDERLYLSSRVLDHGDPRFVKIFTRSQQEFQKLDDEHKLFLKTILEKLEEHDIQFQKYKEPAGLCRFDFAHLRKMIETQLEKQHLPPSGA